MIKGHDSYYLRLMPCFCTPENTELHKASHHHVSSDPGAEMDAEIINVAVCPNRFPPINGVEGQRERSGSSPIPIPVPVPVPGPSGSTAPWTRIPIRRPSLLNPLDAIGSRATNARRTTVGSWIHDQLEPLKFAYPVINEVKWGDLRPRPRPPSPDRASNNVLDNPAPAPAVLDVRQLPTAMLASGINTAIPLPRPRAPVFYLQDSPDSPVETPPPRYTRRNPPPRYTSAPPRTGLTALGGGGQVGEEEQTGRRPVFPPRFPPFGDRPYRRGNAATAPPIADPPPRLPPLTTNEPSLLRLNRPPHETLAHYSRHLPLNPTDQEVREYMSDPIVVRELERHGMVYSHHPVEGHIWRWTGPGQSSTGQQGQCMLM